MKEVYLTPFPPSCEEDYPKAVEVPHQSFGVLTPDAEKALALLRCGTWDMTPAARLDWKNRVEEFLASSISSTHRGSE